MRTWAHWTAKTVMLTATFAAAGAGLPGAAFAAPAGGGAAPPASARCSAVVRPAPRSVLPRTYAGARSPCWASGSPAARVARRWRAPRPAHPAAAYARPPRVTARPAAATRSVRQSARRSVSAATRSATPWPGAGAGRRCPVHTAVRARPPRAAARWAAATRPPRRSASPPVCAGNAAAVLGDSLAGCEGTASVRQGPQSSPGGLAGGTGAAGTQLGASGAGAGGAGAGSFPPGLDSLPVASALSGLPSRRRPPASPISRRPLRPAHQRPGASRAGSRYRRTRWPPTRRPAWAACRSTSWPSEP